MEQRGAGVTAGVTAGEQRGAKYIYKHHINITSHHINITKNPVENSIFMEFSRHNFATHQLDLASIDSLLLTVQLYQKLYLQLLYIAATLISSIDQQYNLACKVAWGGTEIPSSAPPTAKLCQQYCFKTALYWYF